MNFSLGRFEFDERCCDFERAAEEGDIAAVRDIADMAKAHLSENDFEDPYTNRTVLDFVYFGYVGSLSCLKSRNYAKIPVIIKTFEYCLNLGASLFDVFRHDTNFAYGYIFPIEHVLYSCRNTEGNAAEELIELILKRGVEPNSILDAFVQLQQEQPLIFTDGELDSTIEIIRDKGGLFPWEVTQMVEDLRLSALENDAESIRRILSFAESGDRYAMRCIGRLFANWDGKSEFLYDHTKARVWLTLSDGFNRVNDMQIMNYRIKELSEITNDYEYLDLVKATKIENGLQWRRRGLLRKVFRRLEGKVQVFATDFL